MLHQFVCKLMYIHTVVMLPFLQWLLHVSEVVLLYLMSQYNQEQDDSLLHAFQSTASVWPHPLPHPPGLWNLSESMVNCDLAGSRDVE